MNGSKDSPRDTQSILSRLVDELEAHPWKDRLAQARARARERHAKFLNMFPFREKPSTIDQFMRTRQQAAGFINWLDRDLRWLGGVNLHNSREPHRAAGNNIDHLRRLLHITVDPEKTPFQKVDAQWDVIPWFGGEDRQIAKKIVVTYYPADTLPIFKTEHLEHFVSYLSLGAARNAEAARKFDRPYGDVLEVGQKWEVLSLVLLDEKNRHPRLNADDNVWFMYCLYYTSAYPPSFRVAEPP